MTTSDAEVSYVNRILDTGESIRLIHFHLRFLQKMVRAAAAYCDTHSDQLPLVPPESWWIEDKPEPNDWTVLVQGAKATIERIEHGNTLAARNALQVAAIALRGVLTRQLPSPEQHIYLSNLLKGLEQIGSGVAPDKALGLWTQNRPVSVPDERDFVVFWRVGGALDGLINSECEKPVDEAVSRVAAETGLGHATVAQAWRRMGGRRAWEAINAPDEQT